MTDTTRSKAEAGRLTDYERDILRHLNGEDVAGLCWGAAMSEAIEYLHETGFASPSGGRYTITDEGRAALASGETGDE